MSAVIVKRVVIRAMMVEGVEEGDCCRVRVWVLGLIWWTGIKRVGW